MHHDELPAGDAASPWERVLHYWFGDDPETWRSLWFKQDDAVDTEIRQLFADDLVRARAGELDSWVDVPRGRLALVIVLDQLSRNIHRDSGEAFASDARAQQLCLEGVERGDDRAFSLCERSFLYMPLMHAEDLAMQDRGVELFARLAADAPDEHEARYSDVLSYAHRHRKVIVDFGRFPHRNEVLGRPSTEAEKAHLATGKRF